MRLHPDNLPGPARDSYDSDRPTPVEMGGGVPPSPSQAAAALGTHRRHPAADSRTAEALTRGSEQRRPRTVRLAGTTIAVTSTVTVINLGGPTAGFTWNVRRINVGPVDYTAGAFPTVDLVAAVIGHAGPGPVADSAGQIVSTTSNYPAEGTWGHQELTLEAGDQLLILVVGLTDGVTVTAGGQAIETAAAVIEVRSL